jgi:hypothetical protein
MKIFSYVALLVFTIGSAVFLFLAFTNENAVCGAAGSAICIFTIPVAFVIFFVCLIALIKGVLTNRK